MPHKDPERSKAYHAARRLTPEYQEKYKAYKQSMRGKHAYWKGNIKSLYGISPAEYDAKLSSQGGCCAICQRHQIEFQRRLHVDHDHETGAFRGVLCTNCNTAIGKFQDSVELLERACAYLKEELFSTDEDVGLQLVQK